MTTSSKNLGHLSGAPKTDEVGKQPVTGYTGGSATPAPMLLSVSSEPEAGYHLTLTNPIIYGYIDFNGWIWTPPSNDGDNGAVLTTDGTGNTSWQPAVHTLSFGTTGLTPSVASHDDVVVDGVLNIAHGGTGATTAAAAANAILPSQAGQSGKSLTTDGAGNLTWEAAVGTGTVKSVDVVGGTTGLTTSGGPVTGIGTITLAGTLNVANGGTGITSFGTGVAAGLGNDVDAAGGFVTFSGDLGTPNSGTLTNATGLPLTTGVTGTLPASNGGTGISSLGSGVATALGNDVDASGGFVTYSGALGIPVSGNFSAGTFTWPTFNQNTTGNAANVTGIVAIENGGTNLTAVGAAGEALITADGSTLSYGFPARANNISGGNSWEIPYQSAGNVTAFVNPGVTGQVLKATTGAAPSWGPDHLTVGTTEIALGATATTLAGLTSVAVTQNPTSDLQLTTKQYVDARTGAIQNLGGAETTTDADTPLTGLYTLNGYALHEDSPVLVKDQTNPAENGLYYAHAGAWTYAPNATTWADYVGGVVYITEGDHAGSSWMQTAPAGGTLGVTAQSWVRISQIVPYEAGTGIDIYDNVISNTGVLSFDGGTTGLTPSTTSTGAITLGGILEIANGGTGATTAADALTALLPAQATNTGKFLKTDGTIASWATVPATNAAGGSGAIQFANGTSFAGDVTNFNYDNSGTYANLTLGAPFFGKTGQITLLANGSTGGVSLKYGGSSDADMFWDWVLPVDPGTANYFLKTDGTGVTSWAAAPTTNAAGGTGAVQFANGTDFDGDSGNFFYMSGLLSLGSTFGSEGQLALSRKNGFNNSTVTIRNGGGNGSYTFTLPPNSGTNGYMLTTNGLGVTSWTAPPTSMTYPGAGIPVSTGTAWGTSIANGATSGKILRSNGTSWGASSLTWPDTVIQGSFVVANGFTGFTTSITPTLGAQGFSDGILALANSTELGGGPVRLRSSQVSEGQYDFTFPPNAGTNGYVLSTDGAGTTSWAPPPSSMIYPGAGLAVSTGSAWGTSLTLGSGVDTALAGDVNTSGGLVTFDGTLGSPNATLVNFPVTVSSGGGGSSAARAAASSSTETLTLQPSSSTTTWTLTLPTDAGDSGQVLSTDGAGVTGWSSLNDLLPAQTNTYVLTSDGTDTSFAPLVPSAVESNIPVQTATGSLSDSGKYFSDVTTTNTNIWSANQTQSAITTGLLNTPTLPAVNAATTANITLANTQTIDGVALVAGNYVLVKNQTTTSQNGIYRVVAGVAPGGNWIRQVYSGGTYVDVTTETTYSQLNVNNGIMNVIAGTVSRNLQYQIYIQNPAATLAAGTPVYATAVIKTPTPSLWNRFVDPQNGNDTNNNGSSALPFATLTKALVGMSYPSTVTEAPGGIDASSITWTSGTPNCVVQSQNYAHDGGQSVMSGVMTFATGSTRNDFVNLSFSNATPFVFQSGAAMRNYFQGITLTGTVGADWLGLNAGISNWITLDNIDFSNFLATSIVLPSFTNAFTFNVQNQQRGVMRFTGTGAANTTINLMNCLEGYVWIPSTYLGQINWQGLGFDSELGSTAFTDGVIKTASDLTTVLGWTADNTYDGWYAINVNSPSAFALGAIFGKTTIFGTTYTYWGRTFAQAPSTVYTKAGNLYGKALTGWGAIAVTAPVVG